MKTDTTTHTSADIPQINQVDGKEISRLMHALTKTEIKMRRHPHIMRRNRYKKKTDNSPNKLSKAYIKLIETWQNENFFIERMIKFTQGLVKYTLNHPQEGIPHKSDHYVNKLMDNVTRLLLNSYNRQYPALERMVNLYQFALNVDPGYGELHELIEELKITIPGFKTMTAMQIARCNECHNFKTSSLYCSLLKYYALTPITQIELRERVINALDELTKIAICKNPQYSSYVKEVANWYERHVMKQRYNLVDNILAKKDLFNCYDPE